MSEEEKNGEGTENGEGEQESFLPPDAPEWSIVAPTSAAFANATWLPVSPHILELIADVHAYEEFSDLFDLPYAVVWRRNTSRSLGDGSPLFATIDIVDPRVTWQALQMEIKDFPRLWVDLHWQEFEKLRDPKEGSDDQGPQYVHEKTLQTHVHHGLSALVLDNDIIKTRPPEFSGHAKTVERFGLWTPGAAHVVGQGRLWAERGDGDV